MLATLVLLVLLVDQVVAQEHTVRILAVLEIRHLEVHHKEIMVEVA